MFLNIKKNPLHNNIFQTMLKVMNFQYIKWKSTHRNVVSESSPDICCCVFSLLWGVMERISVTHYKCTACFCDKTTVIQGCHPSAHPPAISSAGSRCECLTSLSR